MVQVGVRVYQGPLVEVTQLETPGCCLGWVEVKENGESVFGRRLLPSLLTQQAQRQGTHFS